MPTGLTLFARAPIPSFSAIDGFQTEFSGFCRPCGRKWWTARRAVCQSLPRCTRIRRRQTPPTRCPEAGQALPPAPAPVPRRGVRPASTRQSGPDCGPKPATTPRVTCGEEQAGGVGSYRMIKNTRKDHLAGGYFENRRARRPRASHTMTSLDPPNPKTTMTARRLTPHHERY